MTTETGPAALQAHASDHHEIDLWRVSGFLVMLTIATSSTVLLQGSPMWRGATNTLFVLTVSVCKASLIIGFFMHFKFERVWKYFVCIPPLILAVVLCFALLPDTAQIYDLYSRGAWNQ
jgi:caa(3)-type oxidase subunit IV